MFRSFLVVTLSVCVLSELINKQEGASCHWNEANGICVNILQCESAQLFLKTKDHPPICSFQGKVPVVCCTDCTVVEDIRKIVYNPRTELLSLTGEKANDNYLSLWRLYKPRLAGVTQSEWLGSFLCGCYTQECVNFVDKLDYDCKINTIANYTRTLEPTYNCYEIGVTTSTVPVEMPAPRESYLALLGYGEDQQSAQWLCAGTIISENFILTAAHCLSNEKKGAVKFIAVDIHNRLDPPNKWQIYSVKRAIPHPEYQTTFMYNDIALLETENTITFSREVLPACLHSDANDTEIYAEANILVSEKEDLDQGVMRQIPLKQFDAIQCSIFYPAHGKLAKGYNGVSQTCYGDTSRPGDPCQSDSGAPLLASSKLFECAPSILGVTSIDRTCGTAGSSALFTKVIHYIPWIESVVWP